MRAALARPVFPPLPGDGDVLDDPYPYYERLQRDAPLSWSPDLGWLIVRHKDVSALLLDERLAHWGEQKDFPGISSLERTIAETLWLVSPFGPKPLRKALTDAVRSAVAPEARQILAVDAKELLAAFRDASSIEAMADYAHPFTFRAVCRLLGLPAEDMSQLLPMTAPGRATYLSELGAAIDEVQVAGALSGYLRDLVERSLMRPTEGLVGELAAGLAGPGRAGVPATVNLLILLIYAGHRNMMNFIGLALLQLARNPDAAMALRAAPQGPSDAVLELMRIDCPLQFIQTRARKNFRLHGCTIGRGEPVSLSVAAANRDGQAYTDPGRFIPGRAQRHILGFGLGPWRCIGERLARLEGAIAVGAFLEAFADFGLDGETLRWQGAPIVQRGPEALPIRVVTNG